MALNLNVKHVVSQIRFSAFKEDRCFPMLPEKPCFSAFFFVLCFQKIRRTSLAIVT